MTTKLPTYSLHKASGNARVWLNGKSYYLGPYGSAASRIKYAELISRHAAGQPIDPVTPLGANDPGPSVNTVLAHYLEHAKEYYRKGAKVTDEYYCIKSAMSPVKALYGDFAAADFDSVALRIVRQQMIEADEWCRDYINKAVGRIVRIFRWAARQKLIPTATLTDLELVEPLQRGRTKAKDYAPRSEVPQKAINAIKLHVDEMTKDMIDLMILVGCRPGELVALTGEMIHRTGETWFAELVDHKMAHKGKRRVLVFFAAAQAILRQYITADGSKRLFPVQRRTFSDRIKAACEAAGVPKITGHWLRHTAATRFRRDRGLDAAQMMLGHSSAATTERYARPDINKLVAAIGK